MKPVINLVVYQRPGGCFVCNALLWKTLEDVENYHQSVFPNRTLVIYPISEQEEYNWRMHEKQGMAKMAAKYAPIYFKPQGAKVVQKKCVSRPTDRVSVIVSGFSKSKNKVGWLRGCTKGQ